MRSAGNLKVWQSSKSSPGDFRHRSRGRFFINGFALRAALGIPSPDSRIFGGESKYPPAQSICKLRNEYSSCVRKLLARSGFYLLRAQKNRWTISNLDRIFSAADRRSNALLKIALFCGLPAVVGDISALSLEIQIVSRKFKRIAGNPPKSRNFSARAGSFRSSAELLNFQPEIRKFG